MELRRNRLSTVLTALVLSVVLVPPTLSALEAEPAPETGSDPEPTTTLSDNIVVTAQRREVPAEAVGSSVTVITAEQIEARRKTTVAELLRTVPGLEVVRSGGSGQVTSVFLRGGNSSHTLVLVDNVRVNATTTGAFDFADLAADQIERIEIVRGPLSTLYGSEAVAGVISITTRRGAPGSFHVSAQAEAGSHDHRRFQVGVDGGTERFDYSLSYSDLSTDSVSAALGEEDDPHDSTTFASRLGFGFRDGRVDVALRAFQSDVAIDGFDFVLGPVDDLNRLQKRDGMTGSVQLQKTLGRVKQTFRVGFHHDELTGRDPDPADIFSNFVIDSRSTEFTAQSDVTVTDNDVLTLGFTYEEREGESVGTFDEKLDIQSFFVQNAFSWKNRFYLTLGARYDDHSEFGSETTYRASGAWKLSESTRLHASFGTGFRAPSLVDLFFPFFGNPDLAPETSRSYDVGLEHTVKRGEIVFDVTWFDTNFEDLIVFDFATFLPQNIGEAESKGVELAFRYEPGPRFQLATSYTWNDTEDLATGLQLARRPKNRGVLDLYFKPTDRLRANLTLISVADRIDSDGSQLDDYERVDVTLQYRLGERYEPYLRVENLFDEDYEEVTRFTAPGVQAVLGLSVRY